MARLPSLATALLVLGLAASAAAQAPDVSGTWKISTNADLPAGGGTCVFSGQAMIEQMGPSISGTPVLKLVSGPAACPPIMSASLTGTVDEKGCINGMLSSGPLGTSYFSCCPNEEGGCSGEFGNETGPYAGGGGTFLAVMVEVIPTLSAIGLIALTILVLAVGGWMLRRRAVV